ncbi:MAG: hypothetical protein IKR01_04590, partial [Spirochaetales bacterium]|nr:hypothetical protein [Spirochaetales bacterium]
ERRTSNPQVARSSRVRRRLVEEADLNGGVCPDSLNPAFGLVHWNLDQLKIIEKQGKQTFSCNLIAENS